MKYLTLMAADVMWKLGEKMNCRCRTEGSMEGIIAQISVCIVTYVNLKTFSQCLRPVHAIDKISIRGS